jgi:hypothetical protein
MNSTFGDPYLHQMTNDTTNQTFSNGKENNPLVILQKEFQMLQDGNYSQIAPASAKARLSNRRDTENNAFTLNQQSTVRKEKPQEASSSNQGHGQESNKQPTLQEIFESTVLSYHSN